MLTFGNTQTIIKKGRRENEFAKFAFACIYVLGQKLHFFAIFLQRRWGKFFVSWCIFILMLKAQEEFV